MSSVFGWIKRELGYLKDSIPEIFMGFILFMFAFLGLGFAMMVEIMGFNGWIIISSGIIVEIISMITCYVVFKKYLKEKVEVNAPKSKFPKRR